MKAPQKPNSPVVGGVYIAPPRERVRPLDERIARMKARSVAKDFLDGVPRPDPRAAELALARVKESEDWDRRKQHYLNFLETVEADGLDDAFYRVRTYIQNEPYRMIGEWVDDASQGEGGFWFWEYDYDSSREKQNYETSIKKVRQHLIDVFREVLGDKVCSHGHPWEEWQPVFNWEDRGVGCGMCRVVYEATQRGKLALVDFPDAELVKDGNTKSANTILGWLKLDIHAGLQRNEDGSPSSTVSNEKLLKIEHGMNRTRSQLQGLGPDSFDKKYDDKTAGSQDSSPSGRGNRTFYGDDSIDNREYKRLPTFDRPFLEAHHEADSESEAKIKDETEEINPEWKGDDTDG